MTSARTARSIRTTDSAVSSLRFIDYTSNYVLDRACFSCVERLLLLVRDAVEVICLSRNCCIKQIASDKSAVLDFKADKAALIRDEAEVF